MAGTSLKASSVEGHKFLVYGGVLQHHVCPNRACHVCALWIGHSLEALEIRPLQNLSSGFPFLAHSLQFAECTKRSTTWFRKHHRKLKYIPDS